MRLRWRSHHRQSQHCITMSKVESVQSSEDLPSCCQEHARCMPARGFLQCMMYTLSWNGARLVPVPIHDQTALYMGNLTNDELPVLTVCVMENMRTHGSLHYLSTLSSQSSVLVLAYFSLPQPCLSQKGENPEQQRQQTRTAPGEPVHSEAGTVVTCDALINQSAESAECRYPEPGASITLDASGFCRQPKL